MQVTSNQSLLAHNSFGFDVCAEHFATITQPHELPIARDWLLNQTNSHNSGNSQDKHHPLPFILGEGSNTVLTQDVAGLTLKIAITGVEFDQQNASNPDTCDIIAGAGMNWHTLVKTMLQKRCYGLENLALIPGSAGAAPIQNIGAYGVELSDYLQSVQIYDWRRNQTRWLSHSECELAYRHSIFKTSLAKGWIVLAIRLRLTKHSQPNTRYRALAQSLSNAAITTPTATDVFDHVCYIRQQKLPDPTQLGNAGSFFKNPIISRTQFDKLQARFPQVAHYLQADNSVKIAAAWLIETAGWKAYKRGSIGVHSQQALVLVNYGGGNGRQIARLAKDIQHDIGTKYGIELETEPGIY